MKKEYLRTVKRYIKEIDNNYTNMYRNTFFEKLEKEIIPSLSKLDLKLDKEEKDFNNFLILSLKYLKTDREIELLIINTNKMLRGDI
jgi:hypothetical protein